MKNILAIDCATGCCSVALTVGDQVVCRESTQSRGSAKILLGMVSELLSRGQISLVELDGVCVTNGPGSFTGIRIGISLVQGLLYASKLPCVAYNSLEVMAFSTLRDAGENPTASKTGEATVVVALDARMNEVYWAAYRTSAGTIEVLSDPCLAGKAEFNAELKSRYSQRQFLAVGDAFEMEGMEIENGLRQRFAPERQAMSMLSMAKAEWRGSEVLDDASLLQPLYLRNEVSWKKRKRIRSDNQL